jgi:drug/metabolite transporter (DMT)-like permease
MVDLKHLKMNKNYFNNISFLLIIISLIWAGSFIVVDITVKQIQPIIIAFLRFLIATPFMIISLFIFKKNQLIKLRDLHYFIILGLTGVTFLYIFQYLGIERTTPSTSAVLINTNVIFILILSVIFLKENITKTKIIGIILSFIGVIFVLLAQMINENIVFDNIFIIGSIFIILSAICWAIYSIVGKKIMKRYNSLLVITYVFILGTMFFLPFIGNSIINDIVNIDLNGWINILYLSIICSVFGYIGWYYALEKIEASKSAVYLNFIPLFAIILSFFYGEKITIFFIIGAILIIYGVYLTQKS